MVAFFTVCNSIKDSEDADYSIQQSQKLYWIVEAYFSHKKEPTTSLHFELLSQQFEIIAQNFNLWMSKTIFQRTK